MSTSQVSTGARQGRVVPLVLTSVAGGSAVFAGSVLLEAFDPGEALFFSFVFLLPALVGAAMGATGRPASHAAGVFVVAYLAVLVHDWVVSGGDQVFHAVLAVLTGALAGIAATLARRARRRSSGGRRRPAG